MSEITDWLFSPEVNHLAVRAWINGLWLAVGLAVCFEFGLIIFGRVSRYGMSWRRDLGTRAVVALLGYFTGENVARAWIWYLLNLQILRSPDLRDVQADYYIMVIGAGISIWGALCCLFVLSGTHWSWLRASTVIVAVVLAQQWILS